MKQNIEDDEVESTYLKACRLVGILYSSRAVDGQEINREVSKHELMLVFKEPVYRTEEAEPALIFG